MRGDVIDIFPAENSEHALRLTLFDDEVETLSLFDPLKGDRVIKENLVNYSCQARHFVEISPAI